MKAFLMAAVALSSVSAMASNTIVGTATLTVYPDDSSTWALDYNDIGTGLSVAEEASDLTKTATGYEGMLGTTYWNISCNSTGCQGGGPTSASLKLTQVNGGYKLDGDVNFYPVTLTVTSTQVSLSVADNNNTGFSMDVQSDGSWSGDGATFLGGSRPEDLQVTFKSAGSLANALSDPATAFILLVTPFVHGSN